MTDAEKLKERLDRDLQIRAMDVISIHRESNGNFTITDHNATTVCKNRTAMLKLLHETLDTQDRYFFPEMADDVDVSNLAVDIDQFKARIKAEPEYKDYDDARCALIARNMAIRDRIVAMFRRRFGDESEWQLDLQPFMVYFFRTRVARMA